MTLDTFGLEFFACGSVRLNIALPFVKSIIYHVIAAPTGKLN